MTAIKEIPEVAALDAKINTVVHGELYNQHYKEIQHKFWADKYLEWAKNHPDVFEAGQSAVQDATPQEWEKADSRFPPKEGENVVQYIQRLGRHIIDVECSNRGYAHALERDRQPLSAAQEENKKLREMLEKRIAQLEHTHSVSYSHSRQSKIESYQEVLKWMNESTPPESGEQTK